MALSVFIADDDAAMRLVLRKIIENLEGFTLVGEAADGEDAVRRCAALKPDVVFLDVKMPLLSGDEAAKQIAEAHPDIAIIFVTAHSEYMPEAFEVYAFDYLLKPFKIDRVRQTLRRLQQKQARSKLAGPPVLLIRNKESMVFVPVKDILLIFREDRTTCIVTAEASYQTSDGLNELWTRLDPATFFRSHRAYIINLTAVTRVYPYGRWTYVVKLSTGRRAHVTVTERIEPGRIFKVTQFRGRDADTGREFTIGTAAKLRYEVEIVNGEWRRK
jgi:two-component system LytT family response regulator